jgi:hypothetical protein
MISAVSGEGVQMLLHKIYDRVLDMRQQAIVQTTQESAEGDIGDTDDSRPL